MTLVVEAGRLVDVEAGQVLADRRVAVQDDRVTAVLGPDDPIPTGAEVLDLRDSTVLPGLIDLHTHLADAGQDADVSLPLKTSPQATALIGAQNARTTLLAGFTTVRDVGTYRGLTDVALRDAIDARARAGAADVRRRAPTSPCPAAAASSTAWCPTTSLPPDMRLGVARNAAGSARPGRVPVRQRRRLPQADRHRRGAGDRHRAGRARADRRGDARRGRGRPRARTPTPPRTPTAPKGIKAAIRAGVRSIEHASLIDDEGLRMARDAGVWLVMDVYNGDWIDEVGTREGWPEEYLRKNRETTDLQREGFAKAVERWG